MTFTKLLASAALVAGLATGAYADGHEKTKVGFVYVGPVGDGGWTYEHNKGRLAVEEEFGDSVETVFVESVATYDGLSNGRSDGWTVGRMDGWTDGRSEGRSDGRTDGRIHGRTIERTNGRSDGRTVGRTRYSWLGGAWRGRAH